MGKWVAADGGFIEADVIRWKESVYERRKKKRGKSPRIGERLITAEVLREADRDGWVRLLVRDCKVTADEVVGGRVPDFK